MTEGRLRASLRQRGPLVREIVADPDSDQDDVRIDVGAKSFALRDARTILFLVPESIDVSNEVSPEPADDESVILEAIWPHVPESKMGTDSGRHFAAIWWIRVGSQIWIQQFWHEPPSSPDESPGLAALKGVLFAFDTETHTWRQAEHPKGCDCGRAEIHDDLRQLASALMAAFAGAASKERVVIAKRAYPVVSLLSPTPGSLP